MSNSFNRELVANIGDVVFFVRPAFSQCENIFSMKLNIDAISQGKVIKISGASDTNTCLTVESVDGSRFSGCQELFSTSLRRLLDLITHCGGVIYESDWVNALRGYGIPYPYEMVFPYLKGEHFDAIKTNCGNKYDVILQRCLFSIGTNGYVADVSYQLSAIDNVVYSAMCYDINPEIEPYEIKTI